MIQIRASVFETNSSNTHNMTIISDEDFQKLKENPDLFYYNEKMITRKEAIEEINEKRSRWNAAPLTDSEEDEDELEDSLRDYAFESADDLLCSEYLEVEHSEYTTRGGEKIHVICKYGYNG